MTISDLYNHPAITEAFGKGRTYHVISHIRDVWSGFLEGEIPAYKRPINQHSAAWILFILSNCKTHKREDVVRAIKRGMELKDEHDRHFVFWLAYALQNPNYIRSTVRSVYIFYDEDNMASVFTEPTSEHKGANLLFHGKGPAFKIRRSAILEKEFLLEIAELIHPTVIAEEIASRRQTPINDGDPELTDEDVLKDYQTELRMANTPTEKAMWKKAISDHKREMAAKGKK